MGYYIIACGVDHIIIINVERASLKPKQSEMEMKTTVLLLLKPSRKLSVS